MHKLLALIIPLLISQTAHSFVIMENVNERRAVVEACRKMAQSSKENVNCHSLTQEEILFSLKSVVVEKQLSPCVRLSSSDMNLKAMAKLEVREDQITNRCVIPNLRQLKKVHEEFLSKAESEHTKSRIWSLSQ